MPRVGAAFRRQDFVDAAVRVIAEHGAAGATTRRIAAAAGSPLASLHYVFHTKDDLFLAVYQSLFEHVDDPPPADLRDASLSFVASAYLRRAMDWLVEHPDMARAQAELFYWAMRHNRQLAVGPYRSIIDATRRMLVETSGHRVDASTAEPVARLIVTLIDGLLTSWFALDDIDQLNTDVDTACAAVAALAEQLERAAGAAPKPGLPAAA